MILHGDSLEVLKTLPENSVDSVVCDPPYFLTNSGGSGFMGKEWDSLSVANAFAESILRSLSPVLLMDEESSAPANASTPTSLNLSAKSIRALYVEPTSIGHPARLNLGTFSVLESVITKAEVLALSNALCPSVTSVLEKCSEHVLFVVPNLFTDKSPNVIAQKLAIQLHKVSVGEELEILNILMAEAKTNEVIEATTGIKSEEPFTDAIISSVKSVESIVAEKRYSATTSCPIDSAKTIRWITSLPFVRSAMAKFTANPGNIQILSERFHHNWLTEVYRVMKPGAHLLAFAGTRTYGRLANAVESAGLEIRDMCLWLHGQGFPKSLDVSKAIDRAAGAEREVIGRKEYADGHIQNSTTSIKNGFYNAHYVALGEDDRALTAPSTDDAKKWQGFGTALKPAHEPIVLARKPLSEKTVAANVLKWGTGALNIDASRIGAGNLKPVRVATSTLPSNGKYGAGLNGSLAVADSIEGRFPANLVLSCTCGDCEDGQLALIHEDDCVIAELDRQSGQVRSSGTPSKTKRKWSKDDGTILGFGQASTSYSDKGGASRFFARFAYVAKSSKKDRSSNGAVNNTHPTCKPTALMSYLIRLITPPGGTVLDCFAGSGSTGVAAIKSGFNFIGIEREKEYVTICEKRIEHALG